MFERWDKIRPIMASEEIIIGEVITSEIEKKELPFIKKENISIIKHSEPELYPNYFMWNQYESNEGLGPNDEKTGEEGWHLVEASPDYLEVISMQTNIKWINIHVLENLEQLYDINKKNRSGNI